jgi:phosphate transport system substrate-binding protein
MIPYRKADRNTVGRRPGVYGVRRWGRAQLLRAATVGAAVVTAVVVLTLPASAADSHARIEGSGSSWSENAINQWIADVNSQGLQVVFTGSGSAQGRKDYALRTTDFGISDIGYQGTDPITQQADTSQGRPYAYLPIVAGGTSFPYNITAGGKKINNLRLSGLTLAKIFTNAITNWDDPAITADNNGRVLPSLPIIPVVHSEGSGSTYQFTAYLAKQFPPIWTAFNGNANPTEYFPRAGSQIAQNGSDGVMNFIRSKSANGAIGFDEYSYGLLSGTPVAKIENAAGYYTLPSQYAVAVGLTQAIINEDPTSPDYLLQELHNVYSYSDPRTYALSSYSYMILPTGTNAQDSQMTTAKRQTLADFMYYSLCQGQKEMGPIGYSPLPINLVTAGFGQLAKLQSADPAVDLAKRDATTCNNPTFIPGQPTRNYLAEIAPQPAACDKSGAGPCGFTAAQTANPTTTPGASTSAAPSGAATTGTSVKTGTSTQGTGAATGTATGGGANSGTGASKSTGGTGAASGGGGGAAAANPTSGPLASLAALGNSTGSSAAACPVDPDTGAPAATCAAAGASHGDTSSGGTTDTTDTTDTSGSSDTDVAQNVPATLVADRKGNSPKILGAVAVLELLAALVLPVLIGRRLERSGKRS